MSVEHKMKPIWYFVGLILLVMGALILITGIYDAINPPSDMKVLAQTHPGIWWGAVMVTFGGILFFKNFNKTA